MSEEIIEVENQEVEVDYKAKFLEMEKRLEAVDKKNKELLSEKRSIQEEAKRIEVEKAQKSGDFEKQLKLMQDAYKDLESKHNTILGDMKSEKVRNAAMSVASDIASNAANAKILSTLIELELKAMSGEAGQIDNDVVQALRVKYKNDNTYASLVAGSKAIGASAQGSSSSGKADKVITRGEFDNMPHDARAKFFQSGGRLTD